MTMPRSTTAAMTSPDDLPLVLTIDDLARVLRRSSRTIEKQLHDGTFPIPCLAGVGTGDQRRARLWSRARVLAYLEDGPRRPTARASLRRG